MAAHPPAIGYITYMTTPHLRERIMRVMKKPVAVVLDWLWDCLTYLVMNQGEVTDALHHQRLLARPGAVDGTGPDGPH